MFGVFAPDVVMGVRSMRTNGIAFMLDGIAHRAGPVMADRTLAYLRAALNWYAARADDWQSPLVRGMMRFAAEERTRVLDDAELRRLWAGTENGAPFSRLVRVLLLTGQRRCEVAGMQWSEVSTVWTIPGNRSKSCQAHVVPLVPLVMAQLPPRGAGPYVFSTTGGRRPLSGFGKPTERLRKQTCTTGWRLHDLRRTMRTRLAGLRVPEQVAELVIGHGKRGLARVYDQHQYVSEMREALERWALEVGRITGAQSEAG
jgi:integrase